MSDIDGTWHVVVDSPIGKQNFEAKLSSDDGTLRGTLTNTANNITADVFDGTTSGPEQHWKVKLQQIRMTVQFTTTVEGDTMSGKAKAGPFGTFPVSGRRG